MCDQSHKPMWYVDSAKYQHKLEVRSSIWIFRYSDTTSSASQLQLPKLKRRFTFHVTRVLEFESWQYIGFRGEKAYVTHS